MVTLIDHLGKDTLPDQIERAFVDWCIWKLATPALLRVLDKAELGALADDLRRAGDLKSLKQAAAALPEKVKRGRDTTRLRGLLATEATVFEYNNMLRAAGDSSEREFDAEAVAFFAVRVCGWAGWALTDFSQPGEKEAAESAAREAQAQQLAALMNPPR